jgi:hypothetical protein
VQKSLREHPGLAKELRLNDGSRVVVRSREHWLAAPEYLIVLVGRFDQHISYRNITAIRPMPRRRR